MGTQTKWNGPKVHINNIIPRKDQPRKTFEKEFLDNLKQSIKKDGMLNPITVRETTSGMYEIVAGESRYRALRALYEEDQLDMTLIPVNIVEAGPHTTKDLSIIENTMRRDLLPLEKAEAIEDYMKRHKIEKLSDVVDYLGMTYNQAQNIHALIKLPDVIKNKLRGHELAHKIALRELMAINRLKTEAEKIAAFNALFAKKIEGKAVKAEDDDSKAQENYVRRARRCSTEVQYTALEGIKYKIDKESGDELIKNMFYCLDKLLAKEEFAEFAGAINKKNMAAFVAQVQEGIDKAAKEEQEKKEAREKAKAEKKAAREAKAAEKEKKKEAKEGSKPAEKTDEAKVSAPSAKA